MNTIDAKIIYIPISRIPNSRTNKTISVPELQNNGPDNLATPTSNNIKAYYLKKQPSFGHLKIDHLQKGTSKNTRRNQQILIN